VEKHYQVATEKGDDTMKKYKSITRKDIIESEIIRIEDILPLFLNDEYDNIMIFNTEEEEQGEVFRGKSEDMPREYKSWMIVSWDLQLINGEPYICFNATWNDWDLF